MLSSIEISHLGIKTLKFGEIIAYFLNSDIKFNLLIFNMRAVQIAIFFLIIYFCMLMDWIF